MDDIRYPQIGDRIQMHLPNKPGETFGTILNILPDEDGGPTLYWVHFGGRRDGVSYAVERSEFGIIV